MFNTYFEPHTHLRSPHTSVSLFWWAKLIMCASSHSGFFSFLALLLWYICMSFYICLSHAYIFWWGSWNWFCDWILLIVSIHTTLYCTKMYGVCVCGAVCSVDVKVYMFLSKITINLLSWQKIGSGNQFPNGRCKSFFIERISAFVPH